MEDFINFTNIDWWTVGLGAVAAISEGLGLTQRVKANNVVGLVFGFLKGIAGQFKKKENGGLNV